MKQSFAAPNFTNLLKFSCFLRAGIAFLLFFFGSTNSFAQYDYRFQLVDADSHENLDSTHIYFNRIGQKYMCDQNGLLVIHGEVLPGDSIQVIKKNYFTKAMIIPHAGDIFIKINKMPIALSEFQIVALTQQSSLFMAPQSVATLHAKDFERNNSASIQPALNILPGVFMESRGNGGSKRLSVRGSLMRSPFGVRNLKVYWNEFPLTGADGSTPLEVIDPEEIGKVEVLKGPQGSVYGEGHGGAILFNSKLAPYGTTGASLNAQMGSYGMQKQSFEFASSSKKTAVLLNFFRFRNDGYRQQESVSKDQLNLTTRFRASSNREIKLFLIYYNGEWGLPGELDSLTAIQAPRSAYPFALENNLRVERKWIRIGLSNKIKFADYFDNFSAIFYNSTSKLNPYGSSAFYNGLKDEGATGFGLRSIFGYETGDDNLKLRVELGGEYQRDLNALAEFILDAGDYGDQISYDETTSNYYNLFLKTIVDLNDKLVVDASLGLFQSGYDRADLWEYDTLDYSFKTTFKPEWLPRFSALYKLSDQYVIYSIASRGISTPTLWEIQSNPELTPETSDHYELGIRSSLLRKALLFELNGYSTTINNAITEQPDSLGRSVYQNKGVIDQRGVEMTLKYNYQAVRKSALSAVYWAFGFGYQQYVFKSFVENNQDFSGNEVPGVPVFNYSSVLDIEIYKNTAINLTYKFYDAMPLNNANTVFSEDYALLDLKLSQRINLKNLYGITFYFGIENLLDERYSSFNRINATNDRYYNPAPGQTWYAGLKFEFQKPKKTVQ